MKIDLCFQGWIRGVAIGFAKDREAVEHICDNEQHEWLTFDGDELADLTAEQLVEGLKSGKYSLSFQDCLEAGDESEIELFDYEVSK